MSAATSSPAEPLSRPLRADAARNRERVLVAAREAFAVSGSEAQMEDVARRAGVGVGTVYRHFATKEALVDALMATRFSEAAARVRRAAERPDSWEAVADAFHICAELQARDRCFATALGRDLAPDPEAKAELVAAWSGLLERARRDGAVRADLASDDVGAIMCGLSAVVMRAGSCDAWERYLGIVLDGLRPR